MRLPYKSSLWAVLLLVRTGLARGDVVLPPVFSDNMILQAERPVPIFGKAANGEQVSVQFAGQKKTVDAKEGTWKLMLDPLAPGTSGEMIVSGKNTITINNVMAGEVWLASGQSNMRFPLSRVVDAPHETAKANFPEIRFFAAPNGPWLAASPKTAGDFAAPAYYFALHLHQKLRRPFGIIDSSVNGAVAEQFISPQALEKDPELAKAIKRHTSDASDIFLRSVAPIAPFAIRGAVWCQGEGNRDFPVTYRKLLAALVADWRQLWGCGDFPFLIVQLANYQERKAEPWDGKDCSIREAQFKTAQTVRNCALVVTIDLGLAGDVHYPNKKPVGDRAALAAKALAYGEKNEYSGPLFQSAEFKDGKAVVSFTHVGGGLRATGGKPTGFLLCGPNKKFMRADAAIEGDKVVVSCSAIADPIAVRYAWERNPECNLCNREGLPASPFRSDEFVSYFTRDN
jgi:sialate O-acetylesterase